MKVNPEKLVVKANYNFRPFYNDELTLTKNDLITISQLEDGGWWEGTSHRNGKTGWFPSNYVEKVDHVDEVDNLNAVDRQSYRQQLLESLVDKERKFMDEMETFQQDILDHLEKEQILSTVEYMQLVGNLKELLGVHKSLLSNMEDILAVKTPHEQRLGRVILNFGFQLHLSHFKYWSNHPSAVCILQNHRELLNLFMEERGSCRPGLLVLTATLSLPMRHLEKYSSYIQEILQHLEDEHPDRGDTQRAVTFFKNISFECAKIRRAKETELELLHAIIQNLDDEDEVEKLGNVILSGPATVGPEMKERYMALFPSTLVFLAVSSRMSGFSFKEKLLLSDLNVIDNCEANTLCNSFEITVGPGIQKILIMCKTYKECQKWIRYLRGRIGNARIPVVPDMPILIGPPYLLLTSWIRKSLSSGILTLEVLRKILKSDHPVASKVIHIKRNRCHKVECVIFPSRDVSGLVEKPDTKSAQARREVVVDYSNDPVFTRSFSDDDDDEITFLLPGNLRSSGSSGNSSTTSYISSYDLENCVSDTETICQDPEDATDCSPRNATHFSTIRISHFSGSSQDSDYEAFESYGCKILPRPNDPEFARQKQKLFVRRFFSTECEKERQDCANDNHLERRSMPCFRQQSEMRENSVTENGSKSPRRSDSRPRLSRCKSIVSFESHSSSDFSWIDRTPSESSLRLPFCPPTRLDYEDFSDKKSRNDKIPNSSELCIIPLSQCLDLPGIHHAIASQAIPLSSSRSPTMRSYLQASKIFARDISPPPEESEPEFKNNHYVEVVIQISPPKTTFSTTIIPPPKKFSTTVTRPILPSRGYESCMNGDVQQVQTNCRKVNSIRSSLRDSGLADVSPNVCRKNHPSSMLSNSPTSGLSSDEAGASPQTKNALVSKNTETEKTCSPCQKCNKKCLPMNIFNRKKLFARQRSLSMDDATFCNQDRNQNGFNEADGAMSCMDLPISSLSRDVFEDDSSTDENFIKTHISSIMW